MVELLLARIQPNYFNLNVLFSLRVELSAFSDSVPADRDVVSRVPIPRNLTLQRMQPFGTMYTINKNFHLECKRVLCIFIIYSRVKGFCNERCKEK